MDTPGKGTTGFAPPDDIEPRWMKVATDWPEDERQRRERRGRVLASALVALVLAAAAGSYVWIADSHYERGQKAFAAGVYDQAGEEFAAARVFGLPFRDAATMEQRAWASLAKQVALSQAREKAAAHLLATLRGASRKLAAGEAAGVLAALQSARAQLPAGASNKDAEIQQVAADLQVELLADARAMLAKARWHEAGLYAAAILLLHPGDQQATSVGRQAATDEVLQAKITRAQAAVHARRWRMALALALSVIRAHPGFPGAANLVSRSRVALRPKPATTSAAISATSTSTPTTTRTPSMPSPPPP